MDVSVVEKELWAFLSERARKMPQPRYLGVAFGANSVTTMVQLKNKLIQLLGQPVLWARPGENGAPSAPISRNEFCTTLFKQTYPDGILVYRPEEWMIDWADNDKRTFWSNLAETYGRNPVYVIFGATGPNLANVGHYLQRLSAATDQSFSIHTSKFEQS